MLGVHELCDNFCDSLCLDLDCLWAVCEACVVVSEDGTPGVNVLRTKLVPKVLLQLDLAGTQHSVVCTE